MYAVLKSFLSSRSGNFALMTALLSVPVLAGVAMTVEYSNLSDNQSRLQNAVDAAALYVGKYSLEHDELPSKRDVRTFVIKNFDGKVSSVQIKGRGKNSDEYSVYATSKAPQFFFGGVAPGVYNQSAEAMVPKNRAANLDVALVLDTTGSMSVDGKMDALKVTAKQFIDDVADTSTTNASVRFAIVPFDHHINVGMSNRNASWVDAPADQTRTVNKCRTTYTGGTRQCTPTTYFVDGVQRSGESCKTVGGTPTTTCSDVTVTDRWHGCVGSRATPYTFRDTAPNSRFPGLLNVRCSNAITALSTNYSDLKSEIGSLNANRDTYAAVGVMWGMRVLSPERPFSDSKNSDNPSRVMIVMADGDNTRSHQLASGDPANWSSDGVAGDANTRTACTEAKDNGVTVYTIAFGTTISTRGQSVLKDCASTPDDYFLAKDAAGLKKAFDAIVAELTRLRLTG